MVEYNKAVLKELSSKESKVKKGIDWINLDKSKNCYLTLVQNKCHQPLSLVEKKLSTMMNNHNEEDVIELINFNLDLFEKALKLNKEKTKGKPNEKDDKEMSNTNIKDDYLETELKSINSEEDSHSKSDE